MEFRGVEERRIWGGQDTKRHRPTDGVSKLGDLKRRRINVAIATDDCSTNQN